ncbi:MAG: four helix bundle protein [Chloroflexota bacterium]
MPSNAVRDFRQLHVWQRAMDLAVAVYEITQSFPREEIYGLTSQLRRAAVSVPSNIAEGYARRTTRELIHFLSIADGSLAELQTQLLLASRLGYCTDDAAKRAEMLIDECQKMLFAMQSTLKERIRRGTARQ